MDGDAGPNRGVDLNDAVMKALENVLDDPRQKISIDTRLAEIFPDSLTAVSFSIELEKEIEQEVPFDDWMAENGPRMDTLTVAALTDFVRTMVG